MPIISLDLDNTLIPYSDEFKVEKSNWLAKSLGIEPIRRGTKSLIQELRSKGYTIWIYTTSYRSTFKIIKTFAYHGIRIDKVINQQINQKVLRQQNCYASKNPNLFGIHIHVDDSAGVGLEGKQWGFSTIIVDVKDEDWIRTILEQVEEIE